MEEGLILNLLDAPRKKVDKALYDYIRDACGDEPIRVVLSIDSSEVVDEGKEPLPQEYSDRTEYRKSIIGFRQTQMKRLLDPIVAQLQSLGLRTVGGGMSPVLIAEGRVSVLVQALQMPSITHASLDRPVDVIHGRPSEAR